jgi:LysM repeat protein
MHKHQVGRQEVKVTVRRERTFRDLIITMAAVFLASLALAAPSQAASAQSGCGDPYTVQPGDILVEIAGRCDTSVQAMLFANPDLVDPDVIFPGQELRVPQTLPIAPAVEFTYIALEGDTI